MRAINAADITSTEAHVLFALLENFDYDTGEKCWPSVETIAWRAKRTDKPIQEAMKRLRERGVLIYVRESKGGRGGTHELQVDRAALERLRRLPAGVERNPQTKPAEPDRIDDNAALPGLNLPAKELMRWTPAAGWQGIGPDHRTRWAAAYPACDIDRELAAMEVWLRANPKKARKRNWASFAAKWLAKSQKSGGNSNGRAGRNGSSRSGSPQARADERSNHQAATEYNRPVDICPPDG